MKIWIVFLRAMRAGGTGTLSRAELRALCEATGFADVRTRTASGRTPAAKTGTARNINTVARLLEAAGGCSIAMRLRS